LFLLCSPILAILGLFVGFELIRRSEPTPTLMVTSTPSPTFMMTSAPTTYYNDNSYDNDYNDNSYSNDNEGFNNNSLNEEDKKSSFFTASNQFPYTLEEEVVKVMAPPQKVGARTYQDEYQPILDTIHDAENI
jgi:hypothetical protein